MQRTEAGTDAESRNRCREYEQMQRAGTDEESRNRDGADDISRE